MTRFRDLAVNALFIIPNPGKEVPIMMKFAEREARYLKGVTKSGVLILNTTKAPQIAATQEVQEISRAGVAAS